jgi:hypothetical protein
VALVIGSSNYRSVARLANPANDAKLIANALKSFGFELIGGGAQLDLDKAGFDAVVQSFWQSVAGRRCRPFLVCRPQSWPARHELPRPGERQPEPGGRSRFPNGGCRGGAAPDGGVSHEAQRRHALPQHSPYSKALAETIRKPGLDIFQSFNRVGVVVKKATGGSQQPWISISPIEGEFFFAGR